MKFNREMLLLYAITDGNGDCYGKVKAALDGGATMIQLREKDADEEKLLRDAEIIKGLCRRYDVPFIINDDPGLALKCGADGVHVGITDTPVADIRKMAGSDLIVGATAKTPEQAQAAQDSGADYIGVGAVFPSPTKKNAIRITNEQLREICSCVAIPAVAIGGIDLGNIGELEGSGISGIAAVSAVFGAVDIENAARLMKTAAKRVVKDTETPLRFTM